MTTGEIVPHQEGDYMADEFSFAQAIATAALSAGLTYLATLHVNKKDREHAATLVAAVELVHERRASLALAENLESFCVRCSRQIDEIFEAESDAVEHHDIKAFHRLKQVNFTYSQICDLHKLTLGDVNTLHRLEGNFNDIDQWIRDQWLHLDEFDAYAYEKQRLALFGMQAWDLAQQFRRKIEITDAPKPLDYKELQDYIEKMKNINKEQQDNLIPPLRLDA
tara:strand:- start:186996 stop:187664 length:669 start_codon:yes stop_codon:yes gene_type:complete